MSNTTDLGTNIPTQPHVPSSTIRTIKNGEEYVRIELERSDKIPPDGLFVAHNGRAWKIKPGVEVDVPRALLSVLNDAVESYPVTDPATEQVVGYTDRRAYSYRLVLE